MLLGSFRLPDKIQILVSCRLLTRFHLAVVRHCVRRIADRRRQDRIHIRATRGQNLEDGRLLGIRPHIRIRIDLGRGRVEGRVRLWGVYHLLDLLLRLEDMDNLEEGIESPSLVTGDQRPRPRRNIIIIIGVVVVETGGSRRRNPEYMIFRKSIEPG